MDKFLLLGGSGYVGSAFVKELERRGADYLSLSRRKLDYTRFGTLLEILQTERPSFLINCAGYTGKPNVDACEKAKADTLLGNVALPQTIAQACEVAGVPWGHVSSGCIYTGAKIHASPQTEPRALAPGPGSSRPSATGHQPLATSHSPLAAHPQSPLPSREANSGGEGRVRGQKEARIYPDLMDPAARPLWENNPERLSGFTEDDPPNFSFRSPPCSFYSGSKAVGEEVLADAPDTYIWRLRIPFDHEENPRNYLTKIQRYARVYDNVNSLSHRADFARACLDLWQLRAPFGIYNVTNPGWVTARMVVERMCSVLELDREFEFFASDDEFYQTAAGTPRSNTILDTTKLLSTGIDIRPVEEALTDALTNWSTQTNKKLEART